MNPQMTLVERKLAERDRNFLEGLIFGKKRIDRLTCTMRLQNVVCPSGSLHQRYGFTNMTVTASEMLRLV